MTSIKNKVVQYISSVQPTLDKYASERDSFLENLESRLQTLVKSSSISQDEARNIYKEAKADPSSIIKHIKGDPSYNDFGFVSEKTASEGKIDSFLQLAIS